MAPLAAPRSVRLLVLAIPAALLVVTLLSSRPTAAFQDVVRLAKGSVVSLATPPFLQVGKRYAFTWAGGGPAQTYTIKSTLPDGWVVVEVADPNTDLNLYVPGQFPTMWLNAGAAISIQEMRPLP
jgi:hypothetical protein